MREKRRERKGESKAKKERGREKTGNQYPRVLGFAPCNVFSVFCFAVSWQGCLEAPGLPSTAAESVEGR